MKLNQINLSIVIGLIIILCPNLSANTKECDHHIRLGLPNNADQLLCHSGYAAGYNYQNKSSDWVAYQLTSAQLSKAAVARKNRWLSNNAIPERFQANSKDYKNSGFDRGHLAPPSAVGNTVKEMGETFLFSNIVPQKAGFNRYGHLKYGAWGALERMERAWALKRREIQVYAGPIYKDNASTIGDAVKVPDYFYKVIYDPKLKAVIAFLLPHNENKANSLPAYITSVDCVEAIVKMDFFEVLSDEIEDDIENGMAYDFNHWVMRDNNTDKISCHAQMI